MPASLIPYFSQKMGRNVKPCLRYNVTGMWFYCISNNTVLLHSIIYYFATRLTVFLLPKKY